MKNTKIQWTDRTWNPVSGCSKVSPGCDNCYAEKVALRFGAPAYPNGFGITFRPHKIDEPKRWREPSMVFVNSMSDLFHAEIPDDYIAQIFATMRDCPQHTFQVLTKRPRRMLSWCAENYPNPLPNVWLGTSVEDVDRLFRVKYLKQTPAATRFISFEPLIERIPQDLAAEHIDGIDWIIIGGESQVGARPMEVRWVYELINAADRASVFVKQMGEVWARNNGAKDKKGGDSAEWPKALRWREFPEPVPVEQDRELTLFGNEWPTL